MEEVFLNEKPVKALIQIQAMSEAYSSVIGNEIETTYAHTVKIVGRLEDLGLIHTRRHGRKKFLDTTEKGDEVADALKNLLDKFNGRKIEVPAE